VIPTLRSLPEPVALRNHLAEVYGVAFGSCTLLRSLVNDVYELAAPDGRYVLKLYRAGGWKPAEIRWETGLSAQLARSGLPVPRVLPLPGGDHVGLLETAEGERPYVLSEFVAGTKPQPPFTDDLYYEFGRLTGRFHQAADAYSPVDPRRAADLHRRLEEPLAEILPLVAAAEESLLRALADAVRNNVAQHSGQLRWGVCHGDVSLDNVLVADGRLTLHDFDLAARATGPRT
jgi:Ser/Thr protein kinase RdoA (MazF antagonist)